MQRYMIPESLHNFPEGTIKVSGDFVHHMKNVMRFKSGSKVLVTDPAGKSAYAEIVELFEDAVELAWLADEEKESELPITVTIACGLPKGDKLDLIVQKATELGVTNIIPFVAKHSVVKWDENKMKKKLVRFQKIAQEAAEQSHRRHVPVIKDLMSIRELVQFAEGHSHKLVAYEEDAKEQELGNFAATLQQMKPGDQLLLVFGPEGGLDPSEIRVFQDHGFLTCGLGPRIMRTETAPFYALAAVSYHFELMNGGDYHRDTE